MGYWLSLASEAVRAALELRQIFKIRKTEWIETWSKDFSHKNISIDVKCGIHTGSVLFGLLETNSRSQVTIVGSTVNLSSRLESIAENDQIIVSAQVKDLIQGKYDIQKVSLEKHIQSYPEIDTVYEVKS